MLGTDNNANIVRIFVTPTLTLGMGTAVCLGPASTAGKNPTFPLSNAGNCIVTAKPMAVCK